MPKEENTITSESAKAIPFPDDLRDYFAGQALLSFKLYLEGRENWGIAQACYRMADAMLEARKEPSN